MELYARLKRMNGRLELNGNIFYNDITDPQLVATSQLPNGDINSFIINGDEARTYGLELSADYQATDALNLYGSIGLLVTELVRFDDAPDIEGNELREAPNLTLNVGFDYDVTYRFTIGADVNHIGGSFSDTTNESFIEVDDRTLVDVRANYEISETAEAYAFVNNVFDQVDPTFIFGNATGTGRAGVTKPREVGFGVRLKF